MTTKEDPSWSWEYLPFIGTEPDGSEREIPNYRINGPYELQGFVAQTDEGLSSEEQYRYARLIAAAPELLSTLECFFNIMHDYPSSLRKGYVEHAMELAKAAILIATGRQHV